MRSAKRIQQQKAWEHRNRARINTRAKAYAAVKAVALRVSREKEAPMPTACELCGTLRTATATRNYPDGLVWDHCHASGRFRGWLCPHCNSALGFLRDSPEVAKRAVEYLRSR